MTTIVERDSSSSAVLLVLVVLLLIGGGLGLAYMNGAFEKNPTVIENNKTVENKTVFMPAQPPPPAPEHARERSPERASEPEKSAPMPAH